MVSYIKIFYNKFKLSYILKYLYILSRILEFDIYQILISSIYNKFNVI